MSAVALLAAARDLLARAPDPDTAAAAGRIVDRAQRLTELMADGVASGSTLSARSLRHDQRACAAYAVSACDDLAEGSPEVVAALGISGPTARLEGRLDELGRILSSQAEQLTGLLRGDTTQLNRTQEGVA